MFELGNHPVFCSECGKAVHSSVYGQDDLPTLKDEMARVEFTFRCGNDFRGQICKDARPAIWTRNGIRLLEYCLVCGQKIEFVQETPYKLVAICRNTHAPVVKCVPDYLAPTHDE